MNGVSLFLGPSLPVGRIIVESKTAENKACATPLHFHPIPTLTPHKKKTRPTTTTPRAQPTRTGW